MDFPDFFSSGSLDEDDEFLQQFKQATGMSPTDYINYHRIECSKQILAEPDCKEITISELALEVGYTDPTEYVTLFTEKEGMSPEEYRKQKLPG